MIRPHNYPECFYPSGIAMILSDMLEALFGDQIDTYHCSNCGTRYEVQHTTEDWKHCPNCKKSIV